MGVEILLFDKGVFVCVCVWGGGVLTACVCDGGWGWGGARSDCSSRGVRFDCLRSVERAPGKAEFKLYRQSILLLTFKHANIVALI